MYLSICGDPGCPNKRIVADLQQQVEKLTAERDRLNEECGRLQSALDEIATQCQHECQSFEHLIACAMIGKHTSVIGKSLLKSLREDAERWREAKSCVSFSEPFGEGTLWHIYTPRRAAITRNTRDDFEKTIDAARQEQPHDA